MANNVTFKFGAYSAYKALAVKDANTLYFTNDTHQLFKGTVEYTKSAQLVDALPAVESAEQGVIYILKDTKVASIFNGVEFVQINKGVVLAIPTEGATDENLPTTKAVADYVNDKIAGVMGQKGKFVTDVTYAAGKLSVAKGDAAVETTLTGVVHEPTYDAETRTIKLPVYGGDELTINLGKDMVVTSGTYDAKEKTINLTISTGEVVKIPAAALVDVYTGGETATAKVAVSESNVITVDVKVSAAENNILEKKGDGLYVANPDAYTKAETDAAIKKVSDTLAGHESDAVAHITAGERTAWNAKAEVKYVDDAKQAAIDAAAGDATEKADAAREAAKTYADGLNTAMADRMSVVEGAIAWQTI